MSDMSAYGGSVYAAQIDAPARPQLAVEIDVDACIIGAGLAAIGTGAAAAAGELTGYGAAKVLTADDASLKHYVAERFAPTVADVAKKGGFSVVVATASSRRPT